MAANERRTPTPSCEMAQSLSVRYAELLRLRQEVHQAEARTTVPQTDFSQRQAHRNH
jgi:hypothetical protein